MLLIKFFVLEIIFFIKVFSMQYHAIITVVILNELIHENVLSYYPH